MDPSRLDTPRSDTRNPDAPPPDADRPGGDPTKSDTPRLTLRVDLGGGRALGPGKVRLLEAIAETGSISKAGLVLGMSYRRAWLLVDDMNTCFRDAVIATRPGGSHGGGASLTPFGEKLVASYRAIEADATAASHRHLSDLEAALKGAVAPRPTTSIRRSLTTSEPRKPTTRRSK